LTDVERDSNPPDGAWPGGVGFGNARRSRWSGATGRSAPSGPAPSAPEAPRSTRGGSPPGGPQRPPRSPRPPRVRPHWLGPLDRQSASAGGPAPAPSDCGTSAVALTTSSERTTATGLQAETPASFPREPTSPLRPYSSASVSLRSLPVAPLRTWPPPFGPGQARRSTLPLPRLSPRFLTTTRALTSRCASTSRFGLCLIASSTPPALRPHPGGMNTFSEDATRSPQVRRSSVPPCRPHTPLSRSALRRYFLRRKAASSDQRAHGRPVRHGFPPGGERENDRRGRASENEEGFFVSSRDSAMREKGALNEAARRRMPRPPAMGNDRPR
jgi:hypothetical protein